MGGHGGLNILPQKRWNVYNFDNREKVKRDEEEAARQEAIEKQQARQREAESRLEKLREAAEAKKRDPSELRITDGGGAGLPLPEIVSEDETEAAVVEATRPQHFNLFPGLGIAAEGSEKAKGRKDWINDLKVHSRGGLDKQDIRELKKMEKAVRAPDDEGYEFGCGLVGKSGKKPWYSTKRFMVDRTSDQSDRSRKRSSSSDEERTEKRSRRKEEKLEKHAKRKVKEKTARKTIEELRAERVQREQQERDKARKVVIANRKVNGDNGYGNVNPSGRPYYHQSFGNAR